MEVILLERVAKLGQTDAVVEPRDGAGYFGDGPCR